MSPKNKDLLHDPQPKVVAMYNSVIEMINEGIDINTMKVVDITTRSGIGKGTAYEYFSSKEEIITKALLYDMMNHMEAMRAIAESGNSFEDKIKAILDYGAAHYHEGRTFFQILKVALGAFDSSESLTEEFTKMKEENVCSQFVVLQDDIMKAGVEENVISETNVMRQRMVFNSQMFSFSMFLSANHESEEFALGLEDAKQFVYDNIVKLLS